MKTKLIIPRKFVKIFEDSNQNVLINDLQQTGNHINISLFMAGSFKDSAEIEKFQIPES